MGLSNSSGSHLRPSSVDILAEAFDHAWARVKDSNAPYAAEEYALAARTILARYIINAARKGEWNPKRLADDALLHLARQKLSRVPPTGLS